MKKHALSLLIPVILTANVLASETNQPVVLPGYNPIQESYDALSQLAIKTSADPNTFAAIKSSEALTSAASWQSTASLGLTATEGNSDSAMATGKFQTHRRTLLDDWNIGADAAYGEADKIKNAETLHGYSQYNYLFNERWYGYVRADALHDDIADVTYRFTFSPGAGYFFIKTLSTSLAGETGPAVLYEKLDDEYHAYPVLRIAEIFQHKFDAHARVWQNVEFLPPVNSPGNFLVNAEIGVETPITKTFSLQAYVDDYYANVPAPGHVNNDVKLVSALAIKF